ncbi:hypothetical protein IBX35_01720 [Candidatus Bathyarchaeota archaeon]|nr:hypothetical protein [Candidatus Bathyarchaeota archaeon]
MYAVWIKIDETLPWIELKGKYRTKREAKKAARYTLDRVEIRVVEMPEKKRQVRALATTH